MRGWRNRAAGMLLGVAGLVWACSGETGNRPDLDEVGVSLELVGLRALQPATEGSYEAWTIGSDQVPRSAGRFNLPDDGRVTVRSSIANPVEIMLTVETPGDEDALPGRRLIGGTFEAGAAELTVDRYLLPGVPLEPHPGTHALFTPSDNPELGFPSYEDAGLWVFNPRPNDTKHNDFFLFLTPLRDGWIYEGWIVHDYGTPDECWISYGKFAPNQSKQVDDRDDTGLGVFSGQIDFLNAMEETVNIPGDDWLTNLSGLPVPCGLTLPFDLNGDAASGIASRWTHVITIEPDSDQGEAYLSEQPFFLQPYSNPIGEGEPYQGRVIEFHPEMVPTGTALIQK